MSYLKNRDFIFSVILSIILLVFSLGINSLAGQYSFREASNPVTDLVLSNTRVYDVDFIFIYGAISMWVIVGLLLIFKPEKIPFTLKSISLFIIIRAFFTTLTHIGPFPTHVIINPASFISDFTFGGDLFFSGHTGLPFLLGLIFWKDWRWRTFFIASSVLFGAVVLLGHLHYSIDVASAFFITYTIYHLALFIFKTDKKTFDQGLAGQAG